MRRKIVIIVAFFFSILAWYFYPTEYDRLMKTALEKHKVNPQKKDFDGEVEPPMPNRDENDKMILGVDSNKNGIRDDVDIWINRVASDYNERMAMRQYARALQKKLQACEGVNIDNMSLREIEKKRDEMTVSARDYIDASLCLSAVTDYKRGKDYLEKTLNKLLKNLKEREVCLRTFEKFNYSAQASNIAENLYCRFNLQNKEDVIKAYREFVGYKK